MIKTRLEESVKYLNSQEALQSLEADAYWPKWNGPWWHMLLLHEMGETKRIPAAAIAKLVSKFQRTPLQIFPIQKEEMPSDLDPFRESHCHCQLGNVYQVLAEWGVDVDQELPWVRPWFLKYQMADGGFNCDNDAYLVKDEIPSSMVGTIAVFEAVVLHTKRPWTEEEKKFLDRGARFLLDRKLRMGSNTQYNASERESAKNWFQLCFPRFYLYDVLRGLKAILSWAEKTGQKIPKESVADVLKDLEQRFPNGQVQIGRHSYEGVGTIYQQSDGAWVRTKPAFLFPLLTEVSEIGSVSPYLSKQWQEVRERINRWIV